MIPQVFTKCKLLLNLKVTPNLLNWLCAIPVETTELIILAGRFADFIITNNPSRD